MPLQTKLTTKQELRPQRNVKARLINHSLKILALGSLLGLTACQTMGPVKYDQVSQGSWTSRVLIRDKVKARSVILNVDINAIAFSKLRLDAVSTLGKHLASLVYADGKLSYIIVPERKYYEGPPNSKALKKVIGKSFDPELIHNMIFDRPPASKDWSCANDKKGYVESCRNLKTKAVITWKNRDAGRKLVELDDPSGMLQIKFSGFKPELSPKKSLFELKVPKTFKRLR